MCQSCFATLLAHWQTRPRPHEEAHAPRRPARADVRVRSELGGVPMLFVRPPVMVPWSSVGRRARRTRCRRGGGHGRYDVAVDQAADIVYVLNCLPLAGRDQRSPATPSTYPDPFRSPAPPSRSATADSTWTPPPAPLMWQTPSTTTSLSSGRSTPPAIQEPNQGRPAAGTRPPAPGPREQTLRSSCASGRPNPPPQDDGTPPPP